LDRDASAPGFGLEGVDAPVTPLRVVRTDPEKERLRGRLEKQLEHARRRYEDADRRAVAVRQEAEEAKAAMADIAERLQELGK
jgi:hypothetical protein